MNKSKEIRNCCVVLKKASTNG